MADLKLVYDANYDAVFVSRYYKVLKRVDEKFDVRGSTLAFLVIKCLESDNVISADLRDRFSGQAPEAAFNLIEQCAVETLESQNAINGEPQC